MVARFGWPPSSLTRAVPISCGRLAAPRNPRPCFTLGSVATDHLDPSLLSFSSRDRNGRDDNPRGNPSGPCTTKPPTLSRRSSVIDDAIYSLHFGTRNQMLWLHHTRTNALPQTPDLGVNFDASSAAKIATGNFSWFRTVIDVGDLPPQNWFIDTQGNSQTTVCVRGLKPF